MYYYRSCSCDGNARNADWYTIDKKASVITGRYDDQQYRIESGAKITTLSSDSLYY
jgi:hypothetical protein